MEQLYLNSFGHLLSLFLTAFCPEDPGQEDDRPVQAGAGAALQAAPLRLRAAGPEVGAGHGRGAEEGLFGT